MIKTGLFAGLTLAVAACIATPASAGPAYLSRTGTGNCSYSAPCGLMSLAVSAAGVGGEVICLDKGTYGFANIQQSVTISCGDDLWVNPNIVQINMPAGSSVSIEGLVLDGNGVAGTSVTFSGQGSLRLHHVRIGNAPGSGTAGLLFAPSGAAKLEVSDSVFYSNGTGTGGGIVINPTSGGVAQVALERVTVTGNAFGIVEASIDLLQISGLRQRDGGRSAKRHRAGLAGSRR